MKTRLGLIMMVLTTLVYVSAYAGITDGLVGYWSFNDGTAKDNSGTGNNGVIIGDPQSVDGKVGKALDFNGDDGIDIASNSTVELADALTAAAWIYPRSVVDPTNGNDHCGIIGKGNMIGWGSDVYNFRIATATDQGLTWGSCGGGTEGYFATGNCLADGLETWYYVALVEDGSEGRAYVNGKVMEDADVTGGDMHRPAAPYDTWPDEPVRIGYSQGRGGDLNNVQYFDGIIDEVVLYNRALSADEINELMTKGLPGAAVEPTDKIASVWGKIKKE